MNVSLSRCADGFMGQRCEFKDLDGTYLCKYAALKLCHHISVSRARIDFVIVFFQPQVKSFEWPPPRQLVQQARR